MYGFQTQNSWSNPAENNKISYSLNAKETIPLLCSLYTLFFLLLMVSHNTKFGNYASIDAEARIYNFGIAIIDIITSWWAYFLSQDSLSN